MNWTNIQVFLENNIALCQNQTLFSEKLHALLLSLNALKNAEWELVLLKTRTRYAFTKLPETVVYQGQVDNGEVLPKRSYKETRILLIYTVAFS